jgi:hypothetical protein
MRREALPAVGFQERERSVQKCTERAYDLCHRRAHEVEHYAALSCISLSKHRHEGASLVRFKEVEDRSQLLYETVNCPACASAHFLNLRTGNLLGEKIILGRTSMAQ